MSPPCVAYYAGNNGGATWVGVTPTEFRVVFRYVALDSGGNCYTVAETNNCGPPTGIYDMDNPNDVSQFFMWRFLHDWEVYFNHRYQTYKRRAHFYAYNFGDTKGYVANGYGPKDAEAEAAEVWAKVHPFASVDEGSIEADAYSTYLAQRGVVSFAVGDFKQANATKYPGQYWSFPPSPEREAQEYASFVCTRIVQPGKVSFSGNGDLGQPRAYGLLLSDDTERVDVRHQQDEAVQEMQRECGIKFADTEYFHYAQAAGASGPRSGWGVPNMATMKSKGVTTIIWPGGMEGEDMAAADKLKWNPEWVALGDIIIADNLSMASEPTSQSSHLFITTRQPLLNSDGIAVEKPCYDAILEVDPQIPRTDIGFACSGINDGELFDNARQVFIGVQLAGPTLTVQNMDRGFHAIPAKPSTSPYQPSCFYDPGDYTCVKDAVAEWYDVSSPCGTGTSSSSSCYRMWRNGQRFLPRQWPSGDATDGRTPTDILNLYGGGVGYNIRPT
jgi:hypothetical protein